MLVYILPILVSFFAAIHYDLKSSYRRGREVIWYALLVYLIILMGFRYKVGADTLNYMIYFKDAPDLAKYEFINLSIQYEPFFLLLWAISKSIYPDFFVFQLLHALIINLALFCFIKRNTKYRFSALCITFFLYYFYFSTEVLRESISVFIFAFSYKYIEEKKYFKYYVSVLFACLFHLSAIFLCIIPFIVSLRLNWKYFIYLFLLLILLNSSSEILSLMSYFERLGDKADGYKDTRIYMGWLIQTLAKLSLFPLLIVFIQKKIFKNRVSFEPLVCLCTLIGVSLFSFQILHRLANYLLPFYSICLANFFTPNFSIKLSAERRAVAAVLLLIFIIVYGYYYYTGDNYKIWIPYSSIFNPVEFNPREQFRPQ